jgi:hypothetical protein
LQESNITEPGEKKWQLPQEEFNTVKEKRSNDSLQLLIKGYQPDHADKPQAIDKNQAAQKSAENANDHYDHAHHLFIDGFYFVFNFPILVASPIAKLTETIKAIANKNYGERIHMIVKMSLGILPMLLIQWLNDWMIMNTAIFQRYYLKKERSRYQFIERCQYWDR